MKKIAICIPTYNRAKILSDVSGYIADTVNEKFFDIYIYDSSPNSDTERELTEIIEGRDNFFYYKIPDSIHSSEKLYNIYQDEHIQNDYNYLWILPDYLFFSEKVLDNVLEAVEQNWDMFMLDFFDPNERGNQQYFDPNEIFLEYAWSITQYGIMLVNCETVLKKADWNYLKDRYLNERCCNFSHIAMYFEMMLKINGLKFYHFSIGKEEVYSSKYKGKSEYFNEFLEVWGYRWYESIHALPEYYSNKDKVIKSACIYTGSLARKNIVELRIIGVLNRKTFGKYRKMWDVISTVPARKVWLMVLLPAIVVKELEEYGSVGAWIKHYCIVKRFNLFCKHHKKLYLYGAGIKAKKVADVLAQKAIPFEGFVVTEQKENVNCINDHEVIEFKQLEKDKSTGIIIALNEQNKKEVVSFLRKNKYRNFFQSDII